MKRTCPGERKVLRLLFQVSAMSKPPQTDLIAELKRRQASPQVREGKDGAIEDIITGTTKITRRPRVHGTRRGEVSLA